MSRFNQNQQIRSAPIQISTQNRAFQYGDALFETIRLIGGKMPMLSYHWNRLQKGLDFLGFEYPPGWGLQFWETEIHRLTDELHPNRSTQFYRIRIEVYRADGGLYTPTNQQANFTITAAPLLDKQFTPNTQGLHLGLFEQQAITPAPLSNHKTCNSLVYILAGKYARTNDFDECLLLNTQGRIAEGYYSNLFILHQDTWLTPPLHEGGVAGTMRSCIINEAKALKIKTEEALIKPDDLTQASAIWMTNAIRGIQWVKSYKNTTFEQGAILEVIERLNKIFET